MVGFLSRQAAPLSSPPSLHRDCTLGFALIETLITMTLAAFAVTALIRFQVELERGGVLVRQRSEAAALATARLEALRAALRQNTVNIGPQQGSGSETRVGSTAAFQVNWTTAADSAGAPVALRVAVRWSGRGASASVVQLQSAILPYTGTDSGTLAFPIVSLRPP